MNLTCIVCPRSCDLTVTMNDGKVERVEGNACKRGVDYAIDEITAPARMITTTISTPFGRLPVRSDKPLLKANFDIYMEKIKNVKITAPVKIGDIILENIDDKGSNIIAAGNIL